MSQSATASHDDLTRILGEVDDAKIVEILALKPTLQEVEEVIGFEISRPLITIGSNGDRYWTIRLRRWRARQGVPILS